MSATTLSLRMAVFAACIGGCFPDRGSPPASEVGPAATVVIPGGPGSPISPVAFGQNYWDWVDWADSGTTGLSGTEPLVAALHLGVIRAGGNNNDSNSPPPALFDTAQIDAFVAYCRTVGAEPILQVPLVANGVDRGAATEQTAAGMVFYANVTKGYGVRYWEIGNEPDLYPTDFDGGFSIRTPEQYCARFSSYVAAMKAANAAATDGGAPLIFLGPEISQPKADWLTRFLDGCKDDVDVVTVHRYPFGGSQVSLQGALDDVASFVADMNAIRMVVTEHARPGTPVGVTESNISYDYQSSAYTTTSSRAGPGTFVAALWTADIMGAALAENLWTFAPWNIGERSQTDSVLGFIEDQQPVPAYYAELMVAVSLRGEVLQPSGAPAGFSVYATHDPSQSATAVLVVNKTSAAGQIALAVNSLPQRLVDCPPLSMTVATIPDSSIGDIRWVRYTPDLADAGLPPQVGP